ncbi:hypothetical protein WJX73_001878 [Symbiochloris irregularis]|uniref:Cyclin N-terminal domain-containing protein n=1 Tax=Symbiochloris irregularis TaxID=706552 RepID=A0AAW1NNL4_9CHLO
MLPVSIFTSREAAFAQLQYDSHHRRSDRIPNFDRTEFEPSTSQRDGLTAAEQHHWTAQCVELIRTAGLALKKHQSCIAQAITFFHWFYLAHSMKTYDRLEVSTACLLLASKCHENEGTRNRLHGIASQMYHLRYKHSPKDLEAYEDRLFVSTFESHVVKKERMVLYATSFALSQELPYAFVPRLSHALAQDPPLAQAIEQTAWAYINDSLRTTVWLEYPVEHIACACTFMAAAITGLHMPTVHDRAWWADWSVPPDPGIIKVIAARVQGQAYDQELSLALGPSTRQAPDIKAPGAMPQQEAGGGLHASSEPAEAEMELDP